MKATRFEILMAGLVALLCLWAVFHAIVFDNLRGPLNPDYQHEKEAFMGQYQALREQDEAGDSARTTSAAAPTGATESSP